MRNLIPRRRMRGPTTPRAVRPEPCKRLPFTPPPPAHPVVPLACVVRPYVLHAERHRVVEVVDQSWLGLELLLEISRPEVMAA